MQGKQGRFTATEDKRNGGVGILGIISKMANNLEKAQIKGKTVWIVLDVMRAALPVWEEEFSKKSNDQPRCIAPDITQLQTTA